MNKSIYSIGMFLFLCTNLWGSSVSNICVIEKVLDKSPDFMTYDQSRFYYYSGGEKAICSAEIGANSKCQKVPGFQGDYNYHINNHIETDEERIYFNRWERMSDERMSKEYIAFIRKDGTSDDVTILQPTVHHTHWPDGPGPFTLPISDLPFKIDGNFFYWITPAKDGKQSTTGLAVRKMNLTTNDVQTLAHFNKVNISHDIVVDDDYLYFGVLIEKNQEKYMELIKLSKDTGEFSVIAKIDGAEAFDWASLAYYPFDGIHAIPMEKYGDYLYFFYLGTSENTVVSRVDIKSGKEEKFADTDEPYFLGVHQSIVVDKGYLYWLVERSSNANSIERYNLETGKREYFALGLKTMINNFYIINSYVYWLTEFSGVYRAHVDSAVPCLQD